MSFEVIKTYDEESLLDGLMDVHVKYNATSSHPSEQAEAIGRIAAAE